VLFGSVDFAQKVRFCLKTAYMGCSPLGERFMLFCLSGAYVVGQRYFRVAQQMKDRYGLIPGGAVNYAAIRGDLYFGMFKSRDAQETIELEYAAFYKLHEREYQDHISRLRFQNSRVRPEGEFIVVYGGDRPKEASPVADLKLTFKEFFTFTFRQRVFDATMREAHLFLDSLPIIVERLLRVMPSFSCKFGFDLHKLLFFSDSFIIYYHDKAFARQIRDIALTVFQEQGVTIDKEHITLSGFDTEHVTSGEQKSYTEILTMMVLERIREQEQQLRMMNANQVATWLEVQTTTAVKMGMSAVILYLREKGKL
jgi:hypothetical protein